MTAQEPDQATGHDKAPGATTTPFIYGTTDKDTSIIEPVRQFISAERGSALAISGKWGEGKTYFWKRVARLHAIEGRVYRKNYSYISLFGITSLDQLRAALSVNIRSVQQIDEDTFGALIYFDLGQITWRWMKNVFHAIRRAWRWLLGQSVAANVSVPHIANLGPFTAAFAFSAVKNALVCIDDLDRKPASLALKDVLGLVSNLVVDRNCSVVVVLNVGTLGNDQEDWDEQREKVFSTELTFLGSPETACSYIFEDDDKSMPHRLTIEAIVALDISNVRIVERIRRIVDVVFEALGFEVTEVTTKQIVRGLALIMYCHIGRGVGAPPLDLAKGKTLAERIATPGAPVAKDLPTPQVIAWNGILRRYGYYLDGDLDELLEDAVVTGVPDTASLRGVVRRLDTQVDVMLRGQAFEHSWRLFHDHLSDNRQELIETMSRTYFAAVDSISANNADATIVLMKELGEPALSAKMIESWVDARSGNRWKELSLGNSRTFGRVEDPDFVAAIENAYGNAIKTTTTSFDTAWVNLARRMGLSEEDVQSLVTEPVETYVNYMREHGGDATSNAIEAAVSNVISARPEEAAIIRERVSEALRILSNETVLNKIRFDRNYAKFFPS